MVIGFVIHLHFSHVAGQCFSFNKIKNSNEVPLLIGYRIALHEVSVPGDKFEDAGLLFRASKTLEFDIPDVGHELFVKDQFHDLEAAVLQIDHTLDPELDVVLQTESQLLGVMADQIGPFLQDHHIVVFHLKEISGIRVYPKPFRDLVRREPSRDHSLQGFLGVGIVHG
jgi:hypothetical protein